jgi:F0F1-type ATP synthase assembly protein I
VSAPEPKQPPESSDSSSKQGWQLAHVGLQYGATLLLFTGLGYWLDQRFLLEPWFTIIGAFSGFGFGFYSLIRKLQS